MDGYSEVIHKSRYARFDYSKGRRESWEETVDRLVGYWHKKGMIDDATGKRLFDAIYAMDIMPSMRCMMTAGDALDRDNVAGFNCSYAAVDHPRVFDEIMYILMCGTGVGFSVERNFICKLPEVSEEMHDTGTIIKVSDSKIGWASAFRELVAMLYAGKVPQWDISGVRKAGERLKTFGGRASGPEPLVSLFNFTVGLFKDAKGRKLTSIECHDLVCKVAEIVVVGGVRRSALISLSNLSDDRMRRAKQGQWWVDNGQRALANNSVSYTEKPDFESFQAEMKALYDSKCGERGIFSRVAAQKIAARNGRRDASFDFGTNPCSEIILRSNQFCNLSEVVVREDDTLETLLVKVELATILGTLQSSLVDFRYLRKLWAKNTAEEALLGVSLTGIMDHAVLGGRQTYFVEKSGHNVALSAALETLKAHAVTVNKDWAERIGVNQSTAITCVKPSGTVSQLTNSASGIHPRFSEYYIRRVRMDKKDPMTQFMIDAGVPSEDDLRNPATSIFSFPIKAPKGAVTTRQLGALKQLELWKMYQDNWCEHKPSITVYYTDDEFFDVCSWSWKNFDMLSGISFLPHSEHTYEQAPYEEINKDQYEEMLSQVPKLNWEGMTLFESDDFTTASQELACVGNSCELP